MIDEDEFIEKLEAKYGEIDDNGCYVGGEWLSLERIIRILKNCTYYEEE